MNVVSPITDALVRHQGRRTQGVPTLSTLVGPTGLGLGAWRGWADSVGRPWSVASDAEPTVFLTAWVETAFAAAAPIERACRWLAQVTARDAVVVAHEVERMSRYDLDVLWRSLPVNSTRPATAAALLILSDCVSGQSTEPGRFVRELEERRAAPNGEVSVVRAIAELYPAELWPALLLVPPEVAPEEWGLVAARALERVVAAEPRVPVALALGVDEYARLIARRPEMRAVALLREGFVELHGVSGNQLEKRLREAGVEPQPSATAARLVASGLAEEVAATFVAAAKAIQNPTPAELASDFRSVHEEFLFEQLQSMPRTVGLFHPNHALDFRHGHKSAEADLLADSIKLVVEVDGGHYHLNPDQYRRDRRKDWLYQRHGYLVLRFLAEDVVSDLELVLNTILEAVELRRASAKPTGAA